MENLLSITEGFLDKKVVVIGDVILDKYIYGEVSRISPEAPIQILNVNKEIYELGGAANVASNISALRGNVSLFGFVGDDERGEIIKNLLKEKNINYYFGINSQTTMKARLIGKKQQIVRADYEDCSEKFFDAELKEEMKKEIENSDIILVSDYAKGTMTKDLMGYLEKYKHKIIANPKPKNKNLYKDVLLIILNKKEAFQMAYEGEVGSVGRALKEELNSDILITLGEKGMMLFSPRELEIPTYAKEIFDVVGAGDTVAATIALAVASGASLEEAAIIANHAASIAVSKLGTYHVSLKELRQELSGEKEKLKSFEELKKIAEELKRKNKKIVWTNGCFDLLHEGHVGYLKKAKEFGDCLIVGVNSDESVRKLKGAGRPVRPEKARTDILCSLEAVDYVIIFPEFSVEKYLEELKPHIYAKASDYALEKLNQKERKAIESYNGEIIFIPIEDFVSTSEIIKKIKNGGAEK